MGKSFRVRVSRQYRQIQAQELQKFGLPEIEFEVMHKTFKETKDAMSGMSI